MSESTGRVSFEDLEDPRDLEPESRWAPRSYLEHAAEFAGTAAGQRADVCRACGGSGKFHSKFTGRVVGDCFRCQGTGRVSKGTNQRVETRKRNEAVRAQEEAQRRSEFAAAHRAEIRYAYDRMPRSEFFASLVGQLEARGSLSERQLEAIRNNIARDAERAREQTASVAAAAPATGLDLSVLPAGRYAVPGNDTRLKVLVRRPEPPSKWAGWVFVSDAAEYGQRRNYGRQGPGRAYSGQIEAELTAILADPKAASAAYGKLTGTCGVCGRHLEDEESVARGIGPICAGKLGW